MFLRIMYWSIVIMFVGGLGVAYLASRQGWQTVQYYSGFIALLSAPLAIVYKIVNAVVFSQRLKRQRAAKK